ncbi:YbaN family protein [Pseudobdellovibrio exovorus]|uniref:Inner membrane protein n=1 Tax=Pseudobdellovibrio exovorus JSS TaxID=1184267 RepID=M4V5I8_9BACT|nr:YbaN family protein [Pseudobdellovibrio exovorus]AGH94607.1 hypothetical protein A11Q_387 [Pseudobdellovibrio exovorus JSS]
MSASKTLKAATGLKKYLYLSVGTLSLALGIIGAFLPLLPTTVFLLITAYCYERGSDRFHDWLIQHRYLGPPIVDWRKHQVIRVRHKMLATSMMLIGAYFVYSKPTIPLWVQIMYGFLMVGVLSFIWTRKSQRDTQA